MFTLPPSPLLRNLRPVRTIGGQYCNTDIHKRQINTNNLEMRHILFAFHLYLILKAGLTTIVFKCREK